MLSLARAKPALAAFTLSYLCGFLVLGVIVDSDVAVPYVVLIGGLIAVVSAVERRVGLGDEVLWGLSAWGLVHMAGGVVPIGADRTLYNVVLLPGDLLRFDQAVHAFGFGFATLACGKVLRRWLPGRRVGAGPAVLIVLAGLGVGAVNEILEFVATLVLEETNVGGYRNTSWDLVADLVGAVAAALWLVHSSPGERAPAPGELRT